MIARRAAALAAVILTSAAGLATPAAGAPPTTGDDLWPYPQRCVTVALDQVRGVYRPDSTRWEPWFDVTVRGRSTPCGPGDGRAALAITQYHLRDGATVGLMSAPWLTAAGGTTSFARAGRIEPDVAALCVSTGLSRQGDAVLARNSVCVRPRRSGTDHLVTRFDRVALTDPLVNAALSGYPTASTEPTGPLCSTGCLSTPYSPEPSGPPEITKDTPISAPTVALLPEEPVCHTVSVTDSFAGPYDGDINGFDIWLAGAVDSCDPDQVQPTIHAVRYWSDRGVVMPAWDLGQFPLAKGAQVNGNTVALCLASGIRERAGRLYGVHDLCWRIQRDQPDRYRLVPIRTDDQRVRKPLMSNIAVPDPDYPPGHCASCL